MTLPAKLRIGVRSGRLAAALAHEVQHALEQAHPSLEVEIVRVAGSGDHVHDAPPRAGGFTSELDRALTTGKIDAALHDLPDVPRVRPDAIVLAAVPRRRHPFDVLLTKDGRILDELDGGERIGASSAARRSQMLAYREDLRAVSARGNLETHLQQLENGDFEGLVMAATDAERLGWYERVSEIFTTEVCVPEVGQGALALEVLADRKDVISAVRSLNDASSHGAVIAERAWLSELGDHEDFPGGALANVVDGRLVIEAVVVSLDGLEVVRDEAEGPAASAEAIGAKLAVRMLERGAHEILEALAGEETE
ncbi:MAG TPA: hydroxymethylbilane synthase [Candidatus Eisenbacteria bacterium]|nr:hydroxymethylbilane synthase [Candidatus Eisenbacteria bacterium]